MILLFLLSIFAIILSEIVRLWLPVKSIISFFGKCVNNQEDFVLYTLWTGDSLSIFKHLNRRLVASMGSLFNSPSSVIEDNFVPTDG